MSAQLALNICTCVPGRRCTPCSHRRRAIGRMQRLCVLHGPGSRTKPVEYADQRTSLNDARAALCFAIGVPIEHIHPVTGHHVRPSPASSLSGETQP